MSVARLSAHQGAWVPAASAVACNPLGEYEFRVKRRDRGVSNDYAIRRARETAFADGMKLSGDPIVTTKRVPLPWIGPRTEFIVRFPGATRRL